VTIPLRLVEKPAAWTEYSASLPHRGVIGGPCRSLRLVTADGPAAPTRWGRSTGSTTTDDTRETIREERTRGDCAARIPSGRPHSSNEMTSFKGSRSNLNCARAAELPWSEKPRVVS